MGLKVRTAGAGSYLPEARVTNERFEAELGIKPGWIERATGVRERRRVSGETSSEMGAAAVRQALHHAGLEPNNVDLIIGASTAPQQASPCTAVFVQRELGLAEYGCPCFDINATCLSFYVALETAARLIDAGRSRCAVVDSPTWAEHVSAGTAGPWVTPTRTTPAAARQRADPGLRRRSGSRKWGYDGRATAVARKVRRWCLRLKKRERS